MSTAFRKRDSRTDMDPKGKTALITGAARVGGAVAEALAARGCRVALSYRFSRNAAEKTARAIQRRGGETLLLRADLARDIEARRLVAAVLRRWGRLDVLLNMASLYERTSLAALRRPGAATRALRWMRAPTVVNLVTPVPQTRGSRTLASQMRVRVMPERPTPGPPTLALSTPGHAMPASCSSLTVGSSLSLEMGNTRGRRRCSRRPSPSSSGPG